MAKKTDHTKTPWPEPEYGNDVGPNDEGFWQWWEIRGIAKFNQEADARFAFRACNSHDELVGHMLYLDSIMPNVDGPYPFVALDDDDVVSVNMTAKAIRDIRAAIAAATA